MLRGEEDSLSFTYHLAANQSLNWTSNLNLSLVEYHTNTGNYYREICKTRIYSLLQIRREKYKCIPESREQKKDKAGRCRCHFPGTRSCRVNGFGSRQNTSVMVWGWSVRRNWKYFQRWGTWGKLLFLFPKWRFYFMTILFDLQSIKVKLFCASFDALECSLSFQWQKWFQCLEIRRSEDSLVYCWHYC